MTTYYYGIIEYIGGSPGQLSEPVPGVMDVNEWRMY